VLHELPPQADFGVLDRCGDGLCWDVAFIPDDVVARTNLESTTVSQPKTGALQAARQWTMSEFFVKLV
jgi:hypothetical protein